LTPAVVFKKSVLEFLIPALPFPAELVMLAHPPQHALLSTPVARKAAPQRHHGN
jgi:hypothetical protein